MFGQETNIVTIKLDTTSTQNILTLQKSKHLLGIRIVKNEGVYVKGVKMSDTLYMYIKNDKINDTYTSSFDLIENKLEAINKQYYKNGLIFNKLKPDKIEIVGKQVHIYYLVRNRSYLSIDSISFSEKMPNNIIKNINRHFLKKRINETNRNEINKFISKNTTFIPSNKNSVFFKNRNNILNIPVKRIQKNSIDGLLGFVYESEKKKLSLVGQLNTSLFNALNANEKIHFRWQKNTISQNYLIDVDFPFISGSDFGIQNVFQLQRKDTIEVSVYNKFSFMWYSKKQSFAIHYIIDNAESTTIRTKNKYIGLQHKYRWSKNSTLAKFGYFNQTINSMSINTNTDTFNFFTFNQINFSFQTFKNQGVILTGNNYYSNQNNKSQFINSTKNIFRDNYINLDELKSLQILKSAYYFVNKNQIFYSIHDFVNENTLNKSLKTYINLGVGAHILRKKQNLTLQVFIPIYLSRSSDYQEVCIFIKQTILF